MGTEFDAYANGKKIDFDFMYEETVW